MGDFGAGQILLSGQITLRRDLQKLRHGGLPTGTVFRLKQWERRPAGLHHHRFLLIPAAVSLHLDCG